MSKSKSKISLTEYYENYREVDRLSTGLGQLEFERTKAILKRFLPSQPAVVLDVGGGPGIYSRWLSSLRHDVHLIDQSSALVEHAHQATKDQPDAPISSFTVGDARSLDFPDRFADVVLLFGPLYHLLERDERNQALREAYRVLKHGGTLFAAGISRFASAVDGFLSDLIDDPIFRDMVKHDLIEGIHRNPTNNIMYFTDAYFHHPAELKMEIEDNRFKNVQVLPVEGIGVFVSKFEESWKNEHIKNYLLKIIELTEQEQEIIGVSPHLLGVAIK